MKPKLSPEAPIYIPPPLRNVKSTIPTQNSVSPSAKAVTKVPQCSRYSRKSVRQSSSVDNSPRPILGIKCISPRPILGRKNDETEDEPEEYFGKEFRCMSRSFSKLKLEDVCNENIEEGC